MEKKKVMNLPIEMVEEILVNLPVKSLLRFSSVSKTWNSIIGESWFVKRYRRRAALPGRERIALQSVFSPFFRLQKRVTTYNVSSISPSMKMSSKTRTGNIECEFADHPSVLASCNELWLASVYCSKIPFEFEESFYLWNPSMRRHKKLPNPSVLPSPPCSFIHSFVYGLGYDSVGDDYKILKILEGNLCVHGHCNAELYSLRSDSWREIPKSSTDIDLRDGEGGVFVSGNLHWLPCEDRVIVSFDISKEKFGEVNYPPTMEMEEEEEEEASSIHVLRGMLCLTVNDDKKCVIWMMEEYGVTRSWNIKFTIKNSYYTNIRPLYLYENGVVLARAWQLGKHIWSVFILRDEKTGLKMASYFYNDSVYGILYTDSLVAPDIYI